MEGRMLTENARCISYLCVRKIIKSHIHDIEAKFQGNVCFDRPINVFLMKYCRIQEYFNIHYGARQCNHTEHTNSESIEILEISLLFLKFPSCLINR